MLKARTSQSLDELVNFVNTTFGGDKTKIISFYFDAASGNHVLIFWE